jgi:hypothetical protein
MNKQTNLILHLPPFGQFQIRYTTAPTLFFSGEEPSLFFSGEEPSAQAQHGLHSLTHTQDYETQPLFHSSTRPAHRHTFTTVPSSAEKCKIKTKTHSNSYLAYSTCILLSLDYYYLRLQQSVPSEQCKTKINTHSNS